MFHVALVNVSPRHWSSAPQAAARAAISATSSAPSTGQANHHAEATPWTLNLRPPHNSKARIATVGAVVLAAVRGRLRRTGVRGPADGDQPHERGSAAIVWHRADLRVDDNPVLVDAVKAVRSGECTCVLPVYVIDPRQFRLTSWGSLKTGPFRARFLLQCLADLKSQLRRLGSELLVLVGPAEERLAEVAEHIEAKVIFTEQQVADEERCADMRVATALEPFDVDFRSVWGGTLYHVEDLPFSIEDMSNIFTPFKNELERSCDVRSPLDAPERGVLPLPPAAAELSCDFVPTWEDLPFPRLVEEPEPVPHSAFTIEGGETTALARLNHYVWKTDLVARYFDIRNGMLGTKYSTKLSASLAHGCISPRRIQQEIAKYEQSRAKNKSTYWVIFELMWRDFYRFFGMKHGNNIFKVRGVSGQHAQLSQDPDALQRWKNGTTGWPLVDANMRELQRTGFMSNRGRQNVASYFCLDLGLDWRAGADHFESLLVDYDVTSNWGSWVAAAGLTGGRINRFNITKQSKDYDKSGEYVRTWIPELKGLQGGTCHEPWSLAPKTIEDAGADGYPSRLIVSGGVGGKRTPTTRRRDKSRDKNREKTGRGLRKRGSSFPL